MKIVGNTVGMGLPKPNLKQTDPRKGDFVKGKDEIPAKPEDIGAQPAGNYALKTEIPAVPVQSVNGKAGNVVLNASDVGALPESTTIPTKTSQLTNDSGYLTQHQDISGKLDASALPSAIRTALAEAKQSGEFDGTSVTVESVTESLMPNGVNTVTFSDGTTWSVQNGRSIDAVTAESLSAGSTPTASLSYPMGNRMVLNLGIPQGAPGATPVKGTDYYTEADKQQFKDELGQLASENETPVLGSELASASGWTTTGWTGDFASGFTHTSGNTNALSFAIPGIAVGKAYVIEFDCSVAYTNTNLLVTIGAAPAMLLYGVNSQNTKVGVKAVDTGKLTFTPESAFVGKISNISIREITAVSTPSQTIKASNGAVISETRNIGESVFVGVGVGGKTVVPGMPDLVNVAIGNSETFHENITGFWNVAIGTDCMSGNVSGSRNVSIGANNLRNNVEGCRNVSIGNFAMAQTENAHRNVAIGGDCMSTATGGEDNVAVGFQTLYPNTTGKQNVAIGSGTLTQNTTGLGNVGIGYTALSKNASGRNNVAIGFGAGKSLTSGNGNIIIGAACDVSAGSYYALNIGNLLKGNVQSGSAYLLVNGGLRLPNIGTAQTANSDVYAEEWVCTLEDGSTVTKKVLMV